MSILTRFVKLCRADIHGVMDQMEDKGLLLREYLREMEEELAQKTARRESLAASMTRLKQELAEYDTQIEAAEKDLAVAIRKEKDDIARFVIRKIKPLTQHRDALGRRITDLETEMEQIAGRLDAQRLQYDRLRLQAKTYFQKVGMEKGCPPFLRESAAFSGAMSEEEVELELLRRKEVRNETPKNMMKGGA